MTVQNIGAQFLPYPKAMLKLSERLGATPAELAAWIWCGPKDGGIAAYTNANELDPPPRFYFAECSESPDYVSPMMGCWFRADEIDQFAPIERYITGSTLIERWKSLPGLQPEAFIIAKIKESRLQDLHPIFGGTSATFSDEWNWAPLTSGLFQLSLVELIELEDFGETFQAPSAHAPELGETSPESGIGKTASVAISAPVAANGSTVRRDARKLHTQSKHKQWQAEYRKLAKKHPEKSATWCSLQIAKMPIAQGASPETIRKNMKS